MTTPIHEVPHEIHVLAYGLLGDEQRVVAVLMVAFEQRSLRNAAKETGVPKSTVADDRDAFRERLEQFKAVRAGNRAMMAAPRITGLDAA